MSLFKFFDGKDTAELPIIRNSGKSAYQYAVEGGYTGTEADFVKKLSEVANPYAIGSIYQSFNSTSPADLFGGDWEQQTERFLLGASNIDLDDVDKTYQAMNTGGEAAVAITTETMPSHTHTIYTGASGSSVASTDLYTRHTLDRSASTLGTDYAASQPHNNMPPYMVVYTWKRIA